jgi:PHP family Zn ribbon phosphoesterase
MLKVEPPNNIKGHAEKVAKKKARQAVKQIPYEVNRACYVCEEDIPDVLRRHHLLLVSGYSHREDLNRHLLTLCECCHTLTHKIVYEDGVDMFTKAKLEERGFWQRFVEIDRMAAKALIGVEYKQ